MCLSGDGPSIYWIKNPKAKKNHICCECLSPISPGERYELYEGVWDNKFKRYCTCEICASVRDAAYENFNLDEGIVFGCLWETVGVEHEDAANGFS